MAMDNDEEEKPQVQQQAAQPQTVQSQQGVRQVAQPVPQPQVIQAVQPASQPVMQLQPEAQAVQPQQQPIQYQQPAVCAPEVINSGQQTVVIKITPQKAGRPDPDKAPIVIQVTSSNERPVVIQTPDGETLSAATLKK